MIQDVSVNILNYNPENYYNGDKLILQKNMNEMNDLVDLLNYDNMNIMYYYNKDLGIKNKITEKYYKGDYGELKNSLLSKENKYNFKIIDNNKYYNIKPKIIKNLDRYNTPSLYAKRQWYGAVSRYNEYSIFGRLVFSNNSLFNTIKRLFIDYY